MAHYAFLDENNIVTEVIVGKDEGEDGIDWETWYGEQRNQLCKRTSYNTINGNHIYGGIPFRKNYASIGYTYSEDLDAFIPPKPFDSWILNQETGQWDPPIAKPSFDPNDPLKMYFWDEANRLWSTDPLNN
jgi:hypothetical protein